MELYIGGCSQGKLAYVLENTNYSLHSMIDGAMESIESLGQEKIIINHFHEWFRLQLLNGEDPEKKVEEIIGKHNDTIFISNEVGNGIVPVDAKEREYRERLGRCLCDIAGKADRVERIICGIGQRIK